MTKENVLLKIKNAMSPIEIARRDNNLRQILSVTAGRCIDIYIFTQIDWKR